MIGQMNPGCEIIDALTYVRGNRPEQIRSAGACEGLLKKVKTEGSPGFHSVVPGRKVEDPFWTFSICQRHRRDPAIREVPPAT